MDKKRKDARRWLVNSTEEEFESFINKAKLTPRQTEVLKLKIIKNLLNYQIAAKLSVSIETVKNELSRIFDRADKLL